jgi:hypothetical protein
VSTFLETFARLLPFSFVACCVASALLQVIAWTRHKKEGVAINPAAVWKPEGYFDAVGLFQMRLAKRALVIGAVLYLSWGVMMIVVGGLKRG